MRQIHVAAVRSEDGPETTMSRRTAIADALQQLAPGIPPHESMAVVDHALDSAGLRTAAPETAAWLSLVAYARHVFTDYDELLRQGYDIESARFFVTDAINHVLEGWGVRRRVSQEE
jgi:hypothetical protein